MRVVEQGVGLPEADPVGNEPGFDSKQHQHDQHTRRVRQLLPFPDDPEPGLRRGEVPEQSAGQGGDDQWETQQQNASSDRRSDEAAEKMVKSFCVVYLNLCDSSVG